MNTIGSVQGITAQATTIDAMFNPNNPAANNRPFAFYVSAITNDVNIPISDFKNRDVQVEVYIHHENQVPEYSVYKPAYVFDLRNADISNNADFAKYWHVFNIMSNGNQFILTTPDRDDPRQIRARGTDVQAASGSVETGFVDILCNVPGEVCDREAIE
jgi:hypothetical protein